jgi:hypothetical protein
MACNLCPFRKKIRVEKYRVGHEDENEIRTEEFLPCEEDKCIMYNQGFDRVCRLMIK